MCCIPTIRSSMHFYALNDKWVFHCLRTGEWLTSVVTRSGSLIAINIHWLLRHLVKKLVLPVCRKQKSKQKRLKLYSLSCLHRLLQHKLVVRLVCGFMHYILSINCYCFRQQNVWTWSVANESNCDENEVRTHSGRHNFPVGNDTATTTSATHIIWKNRRKIPSHAKALCARPIVQSRPTRYTRIRFFVFFWIQISNCGVGCWHRSRCVCI